MDQPSDAGRGSAFQVLPFQCSASGRSDVPGRAPSSPPALRLSQKINSLPTAVQAIDDAHETPVKLSVIPSTPAGSGGGGGDMTVRLAPSKRTAVGVSSAPNASPVATHTVEPAHDTEVRVPSSPAAATTTVQRNPLKYSTSGDQQKGTGSWASQVLSRAPTAKHERDEVHDTASNLPCGSRGSFWIVQRAPLNRSASGEIGAPTERDSFPTAIHAVGELQETAAKSDVGAVCSPEPVKSFETLGR